MIIYSFDCGIHNIGVCCLSFDDNYLLKIEQINIKINKLIDQIELLKQTNDDIKSIINNISDLLEHINNFIDNMIKILFINVFDIMPNIKFNNIDFTVITSQIKFLLSSITNQVEYPDVVLIEYQMNINDKSRGISHYIEYHFTPLKYNTSNVITSQLSSYKLIPFTINNNKNTIIEYVSPKLKNNNPICQTYEYSYSYFLNKYKNQYTASKHFSKMNFKYYINKKNILNDISDVKKYDDIADSFMMAWAWLKTKFNF